MTFASANAPSLECHPERARDGVRHQPAGRSEVGALAAVRAKADFPAVMSHDLRTPPNAVGLYADLPQRGVRGPVIRSSAGTSSAFVPVSSSCEAAA
jgi:signal transduction histidine kinase